ncbi:MAG: helix-turn-helix domain-containing protein [Cyclobacteriaceae bacterium]
MTRKETADKLKISLVTLNDWTKRGLIQSYLIGGRVLYKDSEIEASLYKTQTVKY